ncbi:NACHT, LRR and PYD domains-containing protein 3-like isoform X1 [Acipenser ruthenus]|uniref:NACHT, LRR and PYD domains-containing protein 3-like isoform X1 n=1 Tax=Acipenser ruthenus TaxID=7906 RepID=UPI00274163CA|nr:NACHT, LRR and PYD domains-containing protein 3-like isoform X1 [Acipenser ruthenus]XP_033891290.3 NACHT, LRR and PYD domains-containing protein 3-like isoform X1 [Acipenser ruthenus]
MASVKLLKDNRVTLVDELEDHIELILEEMVQRKEFTRDDCEVVKCESGPRMKVRKALDIVYCKGEDAANMFMFLYSQFKQNNPKPMPEKRETKHTGDYHKSIQKHKQALKRRNECMMYYNTRHGEKVSFSEHFVNLLLVKGHYNMEIKQHELLAFGQHRIQLQDKVVERTQIKPEQLFIDLKHRPPPKKILVTGVAGIGKTALVQKILCDFGSNSGYSTFDFVIHFTFKDLNLVNKPTNLRNLILRKNGHLSKVLDEIFENDDKLLIILDGFDEFKFCTRCDVEWFVSDPDQEADIVQICSSLLQGELLPEASVLLTSRPTVISQIPVECIDRFVIVTGFSAEEIRDFFLKYFQDEDLGGKMFDLVKINHLLFTLCYIPVFCYVVCSMLKESEGVSTVQPKTMTDIYTQYLTALLKSHTRSSSESATGDSGSIHELTESVVSLGRLAYTKLLQHETLFYGDNVDLDKVVTSNVVSAFLDKTTIQEPCSTVDVYSFTHFTVQEFFAALYYMLEESPSHDIRDSEVYLKHRASVGYLDLFHRFLSGLLSERNQKLLSKHILLRGTNTSESYIPWLLGEIKKHCESGAYVLNHLHCLFEQQNSSLAENVRPEKLFVNISDNPLSPMDLSVVKYFLNLVSGTIYELDLTATNISTEALRDLQPYLHRCVKLWLGENDLDVEAMQVLGEVLQSTDSKMQYLGLGWTNIGDEELTELLEPLRKNRTLKQIWIEGNSVGYKGLSKFVELYSKNTSLKVIAIWNNVNEEEAEKLKRESPVDFFTISFNDDSMWQGWGEWILQRCEVSNDEKLVSVIAKLCNPSGYNLSIGWVQQWYTTLGQLIRTRREHCHAEDIKRKLEKLEKTLHF